MASSTRSVGYAVAITIPVKILSNNPDRIMYSIQNLDAANYIAVAAHQQVTAGAFTQDEGQHIVAGQSVSDTDDKSAVWAVANTAAVNIAVLEVTATSARRGGGPRTPQLRIGRGVLREGTRQGP